MRMLLYYVNRWNSTQMPYIIKNVLSSIGIFIFTCYAVKDGVFENYSSTNACLFALLMCCIWSGTFNTIALFYSESEYVTDDMNKFLPIRTYILANVLIQLFLCVIEAVTATTVFMLFFDYNSLGVVFKNINIDYCISFFLVLFSADTLGFLTGIIINKITSAMAVIPIILISQFLFSGCLFKLEGILKTVSKLTTARWGFAALGSIADLNSYNLAVNHNSLFDNSSEYIARCWLFLVILSVLCIVLSALLLYFKMNKSND